MHGELVLLAGVLASAVATVAVLVRRPRMLLDRLASVARRRRE